jgi:hypothetical protein
LETAVGLYPKDVWVQILPPRQKEMTYKHTLKQIIDKNEAEFSHIQDGTAYYNLYVDDTSYEVPIPVSDMGTGLFGRYEKGILLMRWIRKSMENETLRMTPLKIPMQNLQK